MTSNRSNVIILLSLVIIYLLSVGVVADMKPVSKNDPYVCMPQRFLNLGLNMSEISFCDQSLPYRVRAKDLIDRMTLREKAHQMGHKAHGVPRLGLPAYNWWSEALHGVSYVGNGTNFTDVTPVATSFPSVIHTTASFNKSLWNFIAKVVSTEARAFYNLEQGGLNFWAPVLNLVRDPRWGRVSETPGEDPFVIGVYATNYVRGLQDIEGHEHTDDPDSRPLKVSACCKHYVAYDLDVWHDADGNRVDRKTFDAKVTEQDMVETFVRPFEMCVKDGDASSVMCSFNRVNGIPACANQDLLKDTLRHEWKLNGYIVSDCDAVGEMFWDDQHYHESIQHIRWLNYTGEEVVARSLKAGVDLECGNSFQLHLENSVREGKVKEAQMDEALSNLYVVLMRVGFFDGSHPSLMSIGKNDICTENHKELALEAAREGVVLLKNDASTLPLNSDFFKTLTVIGPNADATYDMLGNYEGIPCHYVSPITGLKEFAEVVYEKGCEDQKCENDKLFQPALEAAKRADATILVVGTNTMFIENEAHDRETLHLPGLQKELIKQVTSSSKGPVILVVMTGGMVDISFAKNEPKIKGILWVGYPGQDGGRAIAEVVFGKYNPGGRLPITWYRADYVEKLPMTSMSLRPVGSYPGRTYRFFNGTTVYPFAYGLSYTNFSYKVTKTPEVSASIELHRLQHCHKLNYTDKSFKKPCSSVVTSDISCEEHKVSFEVEVRNDGEKDGSEVVMVYSKPPEGIVGTHIKQVVEFERVFVPAKQSRKVKFDLDLCKSFSIVDESGYTVLPSGLHKILLGTSAEQIDVDVSFDK